MVYQGASTGLLHATREFTTNLSKRFGNSDLPQSSFPHTKSEIKLGLFINLDNLSGPEWRVNTKKTRRNEVPLYFSLNIGDKRTQESKKSKILHNSKSFITFGSCKLQMAKCYAETDPLYDRPYQFEYHSYNK